MIITIFLLCLVVLKLAFSIILGQSNGKLKLLYQLHRINYCLNNKVLSFKEDLIDSIKFIIGFLFVEFIDKESFAKFLFKNVFKFKVDRFYNDFDRFISFINPKEAGLPFLLKDFYLYNQITVTRFTNELKDYFSSLKTNSHSELNVANRSFSTSTHENFIKVFLIYNIQHKNYEFAYLWRVTKRHTTFTLISDKGYIDYIHQIGTSGVIHSINKLCNIGYEVVSIFDGECRTSLTNIKELLNKSLEFKIVYADE